MTEQGGTTYKDAGVDIDAGNLFAQMVKERVAQAWPGTEKEIGGFAGGGPVPEGARTYKAATDGAGTKVILAAMMEQLDGIGQDGAAMSAVDAYIAGVRPAGLIDSLKVAKLVPKLHIKIVESVIRACQLSGCELIGGETAELPGLFKREWMFDLDTTVIGFPDPELVFEAVRPGQLVYGWLSGCPGANGFSLLRKTYRLDGKPSLARKQLERCRSELGGKTLAEVLLAPTPIFINEIEHQRKRGVKFAGHAHITGGGLVDNVPRILPDDCAVIIERNRWTRPAIFGLTQRLGNVSLEEMDRTFNNGIMVVSIVSEDSPTPNCGDDICVPIGQVVKRLDGNALQLGYGYEDEEL